MKIFGAVAALLLATITAVAVPNFLEARNRKLQKRTLADLRMISTALVVYGEDHAGYPQTTIYSLETRLVPEYITTLPTIDAWGNTLEYESDGATFELRSWGSDGERQSSPEGGGQAGFTFDLILRDDHFWQFPNGL